MLTMKNFIKIIIIKFKNLLFKIIIIIIIIKVYIRLLIKSKFIMVIIIQLIIFKSKFISIFYLSKIISNYSIVCLMVQNGLCCIIIRIKHEITMQNPIILYKPFT